ncbi:hypothetical protein ACVFYP_25720 [Roseomonas sp. F4]
MDLSKNDELQRFAATGATLGLLVGMLKVKGVLQPEEAEALFAMAEEVMAQAGLPGGTNALAPIRTAMEMVEGSAKPA